MNHANVVYCLSEMFDINLNLNITQISKNELLIAKRVAEIINTLISSDQFDCEAEVTLGLTNDLQDYYNENDSIGTNVDGNDADGEWDNKEDLKENCKLNFYSIEFMREVVDFADAKDSSGKRQRSQKTIKHRYQSLPDQNCISRLRRHKAEQGTKRQKMQKIDQVVYKNFLNAREQYLPIYDIDITR